MAIPEKILAVLDAKFTAVLPHLDERQDRLYLAAEAEALGHGGISAVARLAEISESTIARGRDERRCVAHHHVEPVGHRVRDAMVPGGDQDDGAGFDETVNLVGGRG